ncbi:beta-galactosidase 3-like protein [Tanacetum coccineum]
MLPTNVNRLAWQTFSEDVSTVDPDSKMIVSGLLDQVSVTREVTIFCILPGEKSAALSPEHVKCLCDKPVGITIEHAPSLYVESEGHALHVYVNNQLIGSTFGGPESRKVQFTRNANLRAGMNKISLLSVAIRKWIRKFTNKSLAKLPIPKLGEYEMVKSEIKQYSSRSRLSIHGRVPRSHRKQRIEQGTSSKAGQEDNVQAKHGPYLRHFPDSAAHVLGNIAHLSDVKRIDGVCYLMVEEQMEEESTGFLNVNYKKDSPGLTYMPFWPVSYSQEEPKRVSKALSDPAWSTKERKGIFIINDKVSPENLKKLSTTTENVKSASTPLIWKAFWYKDADADMLMNIFIDP